MLLPYHLRAGLRFSISSPSVALCNPFVAYPAQVNIDFEPFRPINTTLYLCDNKFHTEVGGPGRVVVSSCRRVVVWSSDVNGIICG